MQDYFSLAFNNLKRRKLRSWLTMIGIFIGIAAVVALISLGQGLQTAIEDEFEQLGKDKIMIMPGVFASPGSITTESLMLTDDDLETIKDVRGVEDAAGYVTKFGQVEYKNEKNIVHIGGIGPEDTEFWHGMDFFKMEDGREFEEGEKFKAVVGYSNVYCDMWDRPAKIGSTIKVEGHEFKIVGVMEKSGDSNDDMAVYIPKETLRKILDVPKEESIIMAKVAEGFNPEEVAEDIERKLMRARGQEDEDIFNVQTSEQLLESFSNIFGIVQAVLVGIAAISLLVGGIGIMNTMYTSVIERTKEIGTMKAIGAKNSDILLVFLFESGLLGLVGGTIGILMGIGLGKGTEYVAKMFLGTNLLQAVFPWYLIVGALAFSFFIGMSSGILPAMQASRLKPADALRRG